MTTNDTGGRGSADAAFARTLRTLRDEGASVLVVGAVPGRVHDRACGAFLGTDAEARRRAFVLAGRPEATVDRRLPEGANRDADHLQVVAGGDSVRGAAAAAGSGAATGTVEPAGPTGPGDATGFPGRQSVPDDPDAIRPALADALSTLADAADELSPGDVRLCVDSLGHLFDTHDRGEVVTFCHAATALVDEVGGIGHFHLPVAPDDGRVATLEPVFDLVVELRLGETGPQQRWRTRDGTATDWLPVDVGV